MIFQKFASEAASWWNRYLAHVADQQQKGSFILGGAEILYPNIVLAVDAGDFFVVELIGANRNFSGLTLKKHTSPIYRYLSQFDDSEPTPLISLGEGTAGSKFSHLSLAHMHDYNAVKARFPFLEVYSLSGLIGGGGRGSVIAFKEGFTWCVIEKSVLINRSRDAFRCKSILMMLIVYRRVKSHDLLHMFESAFPTSPSAEVGGVYLAPTARYEEAVIAGQLQALYLSPSLHETTIGDYLNKHPAVIKRAFNTDYFLYEPYLSWLEHDGSVEDMAIIPDLLVRRPDGFLISMI